MKPFKKYLPLLIYLSGCVTCYLIIKHNWVKHYGKAAYTVGVRNKAVFVSLFSWLSVGVTVVAHQVLSEEPAKW